MNADILEPALYTPPALSPLKAHIQNMLCTRPGPLKIILGETPCAFQFAGVLPEFKPAFILRVQVGTEIWKMEAGSRDILRLHPLTADLEPAAALPEEFMLALLETLLGPLLDEFSRFLGVDCFLVGNKGEDQSLFGIPFLLIMPLGSSASSADKEPTNILTPYPIPVQVHVPNREAALLLADRLAALPERKGSIAHIPLTLSLEAGHMMLTGAEILSLEAGDILLPDTLPKAQDMLVLRISDSLSALCSFSNNQATLLEFPHTVCPKDPPMTHQDNTSSKTPNDKAPSKTPQLDNLEVLLSFELERRLVTVSDLAALTPGYTFALGVLPDAPVTLRVNGRDIGTGRIVELKGTLGVQITSLKNNGAHS